ncbi:MAG TPA: 4-(cytidine 5'-diphospho)-2-C-methyl-D-erythritol kinase [Longimicrobiales bacterium]|nr:4-(cytidine 5'-diphospho)-2-C-methyl-D-erythritol kinase [Longimicrobiales bacterium]
MIRTAAVVAPAKVNLTLRVLSKRPDGYHELDTLFQAIDLADDVVVRLGGRGVALRVRGAVPAAEPENLAYRAAEKLREEAGFSGGVEVVLTKRIPAGAGLGGGSSDGAAVLKCLAALLDIAPDDERLRRIALELGSDVPFFLSQGALARGRGRGEVLTALPALPEADLVVVSPPVHASTAWAYRALAAELPGTGAETLPGGLRTVPETWAEVASSAHNDFQELVSSGHPEVARSLGALRDAGARLALLSGSGSSSFGLFDDRASAERAAAALQDELGWPCRPARTLVEQPVPRVT